MKRSGHAKCKCRASKQGGVGISNLTVFLRARSEVQSQSFAFLNINTKYWIWFTAPKGSFYRAFSKPSELEITPPGLVSAMSNYSSVNWAIYFELRRSWMSCRMCSASLEFGANL